MSSAPICAHCDLTMRRIDVKRPVRRSLAKPLPVDDGSRILPVETQDAYQCPRCNNAVWITSTPAT